MFRFLRDQTLELVFEIIRQNYIMRLPPCDPGNVEHIIVDLNKKTYTVLSKALFAVLASPFFRTSAQITPTVAQTYVMNKHMP